MDGLYAENNMVRDGCPAAVCNRNGWFGNGLQPSHGFFIDVSIYLFTFIFIFCISISILSILINNILGALGNLHL